MLINLLQANYTYKGNGFACCISCLHVMDSRKNVKILEGLRSLHLSSATQSSNYTEKIIKLQEAYSLGDFSVIFFNS